MSSRRRGQFRPRSGPVLLLVVLFLAGPPECETTSEVSTEASGAFEHRGAARQMYGSGSLRPAGSVPGIGSSSPRQQQQPRSSSHQQPRPGAIVDRRHRQQQSQNYNSTASRRRPSSSGALPYPGIPAVPVSVPIRDLERMPDGYPLFRSHSSRSGGLMRPSNRGGMYGGRPEYYNGRPDHHRSRIPYPMDGGSGFGGGFVQGRGFGVMPPPNGLLTMGRPGRGKVHYGKTMFMGSEGTPGGGGTSAGRNTGYMRVPSEEEEDELEQRSGGAPGDEDEEEIDEYEHPCGGKCDRGQFLCLRSCVCIEGDHRCDGDSDCEGDEDELGCGEMEAARNARCDESPDHVRCPRSGKCISKEWLCDGDDDCGDFSDETHCGTAVNCTEDQFECVNGLCIPKTWICDNDNDCKDFSDELNCTKTGCTTDEFSCGDGSCISLSWKCDKEVDCNDESDENGCDVEPPSCSDREFACTGGGECIKLEFRCDGDDDCGDGSDEEDCPKSPGSCEQEEFKCNNGKCIPKRWRCDKQSDCEDNEDESNCDETDAEARTCSPFEYACGNGSCILKTWVCDGVSDCSQGEDEAKCDIVCGASKFPCSGWGPNDTQTEFCIGKKYVCDGQKDCPKGEDEKNCPTRRDCENGTICSQLCVTTAEGKQGCACKPGYELNTDGKTCNDINECLYETDPVCSQTCNNTIGSFTCGCMTGYILRPDLRSCKALGAPPTLLFANRIDIRQVSLSNTKYTAILKGLNNAVALDYHYEKGLVFWSEMTMDLIRKAHINGSGLTNVVRWGLQAPCGVALDWIHDLIFWTDSGTRRIEVATLNGMQRAIIVADDLDKPRAIAVHPGNALVFWTDWGPFPKIERAEMDGSNRKSIVTESIFWPNGLTLDYTSDRIYWADAKHNVIESAFYDGSDRKKVVSKGLPHPFALTLFEDAIYWTDWHTKSISTANKATGAGLRTIHSNLHFPMDIHSYHPQRQPKYESHCGDNNGGCEQLCLPNRRGFSCACRMGQRLNSDRKTCRQPDKMLIFARKKDLRIKFLENNSTDHRDEMIVPVEGLKSAVAVAWDSKTDSIYWTDVERRTINAAYWNGFDQRVLIRTNIITPAGLALDWLTEKLYWTDAGTSRIEVANIDASMRSLLIWDGLDKPRDIVIDPIGGYMYWSDWGENPKIERAAADGSSRLTLIGHNLTWPNGLAIDHVTGKLYWADGGTKAIEYSNLDGTNRRVLIGGSALPHPFGLDVFGDKIYWTDWSTSNIECANKLTAANRRTIGSGITGLMDVRVFHRNRRTVSTPCNKVNGGCSHLCLLKPNGYSCACPIGIVLQNDNKTCSRGPKKFLLLAHRVDIRQISLDTPYTVGVVFNISGLKNVLSVDVDRKTGDMYWTDNTEDVIKKASHDGTNIETILWHELQMVDDIAVDSIGRKIYWTDGERNSIEVSELNGTNRKLLVWKDIDEPRAIALNYELGFIFWSDWGAHPCIERVNMDGTGRTPLITSDVWWPNGLAFDQSSNRLYWNDGNRKTVESCDVNGKHRNLLIEDVPHPYGLTVLGSHIYWTDWQTRSLHRADKHDGRDGTIILDNLDGMMNVQAVDHSAENSVVENACGDNNGGCSHLCLRNPHGFSCQCPTGIKMSRENKTCQVQPSAYILFSTRTSLVRVSLDTKELWDVTLPIQGIGNAIDVDFHWKKQLIYFSDVDRQSIRIVNMHNLSDVNDLILTTEPLPNSVAVDWIADNIYWTDTADKLIQVARLDGTSRAIIAKDGLVEPRSIALYPRRGYVYWTDWGDRPKIERSLTDGSSRRAIVENDLGFPNGLAVDYSTRRLYWTDARWDRIETSDLHGQNRIQLVRSEPNVPTTHPFGLSQLGEHIYWTDWYQKRIVRADKATGQGASIIRSNLDGAMGITIVAASRQQGWNPCAENNGECSHLCFFTLKNYTCGCPSVPDKRPCKTIPNSWLSLKHPGKDYEDEEEDDDTYYLNGGESVVPSREGTDRIFLLLLAGSVSLVLLGVILTSAIVFYRKQKKYFYSNGRSVMTFSNPNYYTSGNETAPSIGAMHSNKGPFIWRRLKYDKSQERVYEEKSGGISPEVTSLIPSIITPSSSNCEALTPELQHSPSVTPLHHRVECAAPQQPPIA